MPPLRLIVTDTSPLITLALGGNLDLLLRPEIAVGIPDAVYVEATRVKAAGGAGAIIEWINAHRDRAQMLPTETPGSEPGALQTLRDHLQRNQGGG